MLGLMNQGHNVFLNDADSIWIRKVELNTVFSANTDITHVYDRAYPRAVYDVQRFVFGGGTVAYSNTYLTKKLLKMWIDRCEKRSCDDQDTMNRYYLEQGVAWSPKSEMSKHEQIFNRTGVDHEKENQKEKLIPNPHFLTLSSLIQTNLANFMSPIKLRNLTQSRLIWAKTGKNKPIFAYFSTFSLVYTNQYTSPSIY